MVPKNQEPLKFLERNYRYVRPSWLEAIKGDLNSQSKLKIKFDMDAYLQSVESLPDTKLYVDDNKEKQKV